MNTKQVIVFRKDLLKGEHAIRKGKFAGQVAHASLGALLKFFKVETKRIWTPGMKDIIEKTTYRCEFLPDSVLDSWLNGIFTKIVVSVDNEEDLLKIRDQVEKTNIPFALITDAGNTEFHGTPTVTCLGIGPWESEKIDEITGHLPLL